MTTPKVECLLSSHFAASTRKFPHTRFCRFHMQNAMQDLADFMFKEDAKKAKDPQSWSTISFEQNSPAHIFRFITEISQRDRELLNNFLAGCRRMNAEHDYVFATCNPCILADLMVGAPDESVRHIRKCMMALQVTRCCSLSCHAQYFLVVCRVWSPNCRV